MIKTITFIIILFWNTNAKANNLPSEQWTHQTHIWLSRAFVAEAGWDSKRDHIAIAYVIKRRWNRMKKRWDMIRFLDVVRNYCSGLGLQLTREPTDRQKWIRALSFKLDKPIGWPDNASWKKHRVLWKKALRRAHDWYIGKYADPCNGKAYNWGGAMDIARAKKLKLKPIDCGETENIFYNSGEE